MIAPVVASDRRLPLIQTAILVSGLLTNSVTKAYSFDLYEYPNDYNDTYYEETNNTKPPVWEQTNNDLQNLINNTNLEHRQADAVRSANLKEMQDLLRKSSYNIDNKLKLVETSTIRAVDTARDKILHENSIMQDRLSTKFQNLQTKLSNITERVQLSSASTVRTIKDLIESGFKITKDTLSTGFRSLSSQLSQKVTRLTQPSSNETSQPKQNEPETNNSVRQSIIKLTTMIEGMSLDLWNIKNSINKVKQIDNAVQNDQQIQTTQSPQRTQKTTDIPATTVQLATKTTQKPDSTTATTEGTTVPNILLGLFEDSPTVKIEKEKDFSDFFGATEEEQTEDDMFTKIFQQEVFEDKKPKPTEDLDDWEIEGSGITRHKRSPIDLSKILNNIKTVKDFGRQIDYIWSSLASLSKQQKTIKENIIINNKSPGQNGQQEDLKPYDTKIVKVDIPFEEFNADKVLERINKINNTLQEIKDEQQTENDKKENDNKKYLFF